MLFFGNHPCCGVSAAVLQLADKRYPFGYAAYEALDVKFRSMVVLGIMAFAVFGALQKIITYATGGDVPELVFGPIMISSFFQIGFEVSHRQTNYHNPLVSDEGMLNHFSSHLSY